MELRSACERIARIEERCEVTRLRRDGVSLWPLIRIALWDQALHPGRTRPPLASTRSQTALRRRLAAPTRRWRELRARAPRRRFVDGLQPADWLFLARPQDHSDSVAGLPLDRHLDPLLELARESWRALKLEVGAADATRPRRQPSAFVPPEWLQAPPRRDPLPARELAALERVLGEEAPEWWLDRAGLDARVDAVRASERFFGRVLARVRPRAALFACFHADQAMGLSRACRAQGVLSVDVQHGKQGLYSGVYSHWTRVPEGGWDLLPDVFWVWGEESRENLEKWFPPEAGVHRAVVGGHRWLGWWREGHVATADGLGAALSRRIAAASRVVLVSLQPLEDPLPGALLEALRASPRDWLWLIRLHPHQRKELEAIRARLASAGSATLELDAATRAPLYALLGASHHHVTRWSSVCFEALCFDLPTTLIDPAGRELYERWIQAGRFGYATTGAELLAAVGAERRPPPDAAAPYIEWSRECAARALAEIASLAPGVPC